MHHAITVSDELGARSGAWAVDGAHRGTSDHGLLHVAIAQDGDSHTVTLAAQPGGSPLAQGAGAAGAVIQLAEQGDSGVSGQVVLTAPGTGAGALSVFWCDDDDLLALEPDVGAHLDGAGEFAGAPGFALFRAWAKRTLDEALLRRLATCGVWQPSGGCAMRGPEGWLTEVRDRRVLALPCAWLALALLHERFASSGSAGSVERARACRLAYGRELAAATVTFDGAVPVTLGLGDLPVQRG